VGTVFHRIKLALLVIAAIIATGTVGYRIGGLTWLDALYQTMITVTTVGYSDLADTPTLKPFTLALLAVGTVSIAALISIVTGAVVETQIRDILGRQRVENRIRKLEGHVVLCGFGRFGKIIAAHLAESRTPFVVLDRDPAHTQTALEHDYLALVADATEEESLTRAGLQRCIALLTALDSDAANVYVTLTAKQMKRGIKVVALSHDERADAKLRAAGADEVVSPYQLGGNWMAKVVTSPNVADFVKMATGGNPLNFFMEEQRVGASSPLCGREIRATPIRSEFGVIVVAVRRADGSLVTNPPPTLVIAADDTLVSLGEAEKLARLKSLAKG